MNKWSEDAEIAETFLKIICQENNVIYGTHTRVRFSFFLLDSVSSDLRDLPNLAPFLPRFSIYSAYTLLSYKIEDHKYNLHGPCETRSCNSSRTTTILLRRVIFHAKHSFFPASILSKTCFFFRTSMPFTPISISMSTTFRSRRSTVLWT